MAKILITGDARMAIIENDIFQVKGYYDCTMYMYDRGYTIIPVEVISEREMDEIYDLLGEAV